MAYKDQGVTPEINKTSWSVGDLAYRKKYEGIVAPSNVFKVKEIKGDELEVSYSSETAGWEFPDNVNLERSWKADDCVRISEEEYHSLIKKFELA